MATLLLRNIGWLYTCDDGERVRDALLRHLEKDLGPVALPRIPPEVAPFTVVEYFPDGDVSGFQDPRHHAVSLAFVGTESCRLKVLGEPAAAIGG